MYEKLMEVENAIIDFEKVMALIDLAVSNILYNRNEEVHEKELLLLQELFLNKFNNLKTAFYECYEEKTA